MTREEAEKWLKDNDKYPLVTKNYGGSPKEGRWYPDSKSNRRFFANYLHGLLPPEVYYAMKFQHPENWKDGVYPWFKPYDAAVEAAIESLMAWQVPVTEIDKDD